MAVRAAVLGASGYSGGELLRLLARHPAIDVVAVAAHAHAGGAVDDVLPGLHGAFALTFEPLDVALDADADIVLSCLPPGLLRDHADRLADRVVIDLSDDMRGREGWVYGLTEFARQEIADAKRIANPGCYPTAALLALAPFARAGLIDGPVAVDGMSGVSGAGRRLEDRLLYGSIEGGITAYADLPHRHVQEIERGLATFGSIALKISFVPHLVPMTRGLLITAHAPLNRAITRTEALEVLHEVYRGELFVDVVERWPATKAVAGTNRALVSARADRDNSLLIVSCAIDNLGKGAAGQALQNANLALGLDEATGLEGFGVWP